jgi:hypothetical protein
MAPILGKERIAYSIDALEFFWQTILCIATSFDLFRRLILMSNARTHSEWPNHHMHFPSGSHHNAQTNAQTWNFNPKCVLTYRSPVHIWHWQSGGILPFLVLIKAPSYQEEKC